MSMTDAGDGRPLDRTALGVTVWQGRQEGEHLTWGGPGDGVHLRTGSVEIGGQDFLGTDAGLIGPARHASTAGAQEAVSAYLALYGVTGEVRYTTLDQFYAADSARKFSGEADYGVHWRYRGQRHPPWRVSYVRDTGEIYAVCGGGGPVIVLGRVPADPAPLPGSYYATLDAVLDGWEHPGVTGWDLGWIRRRLETHAREAGQK